MKKCTRRDASPDRETLLDSSQLAWKERAVLVSGVMEGELPEGEGLADRNRNYGASHGCFIFPLNVYTMFQGGLLVTMENSRHEVSRAFVLSVILVLLVFISVPTKKLLHSVMIQLKRLSLMHRCFPTRSSDGKTLLIP